MKIFLFVMFLGTPLCMSEFAEAALASPLEGKWSGACQSYNDGGWMMMALVFAGDHLAVTINEFSDKYCTHLQAWGDGDYAFYIGSAVVTEPEAYEIDLMAPHYYGIFKMSGDHLYISETMAESPDQRPTHLSPYFTLMRR